MGNGVTHFATVGADAERPQASYEEGVEWHLKPSGIAKRPVGGPS